MLVGAPLSGRLTADNAPSFGLWLRKVLRLLLQPLRHPAMMRARPLPRAAKAERPVPAVGCGPLGRLAIRSPRGRWHPLPLGIDVAPPLCRRGLRRLRAEKLFEQVAGELRN